MHPAIKPPIWPMYAMTQEPRGRQLLVRVQTRYKGRLMDVQQTLSEETHRLTCLVANLGRDLVHRLIKLRCQLRSRRQY